MKGGMEAHCLLRRLHYMALRKSNGMCFGAAQENIKLLEMKLKEIQLGKLDDWPNQAVVKVDIIEHRKRWECTCRQKSRELWLRERG